MKIKPYLLTLLMSATLLLADGSTTIVRVATPDWAKYKTTNAYGLVEFWATKPYLLHLDTSPKEPFCWWADSAEDFGLYDCIETGVVNKNWAKSLRRLK